MLHSSYARPDDCRQNQPARQRHQSADDVQAAAPDRFLRFASRGHDLVSDQEPPAGADQGHATASHRLILVGRWPITSMKRLPLTHLLVICAALVALAAIAWFYTNANESVEGIPPVATPEVHSVPTTKDACETAGGVWNECASACPPDAEACIQMCVQKCEFPDVGENGHDALPETVRLYFLNQARDPQTTCEKVFPVERTLFFPGDDVFEALLAGPNEEERKAGYTTAIPKGVSFLKEQSEGNVTRLSFDGKLDESVAGSCRVTAIRAQIEATVRAAGSIPESNAIEITAGEKSARETLQP